MLIFCYIKCTRPIIICHQPHLIILLSIYVIKITFLENLKYLGIAAVVLAFGAFLLSATMPDDKIDFQSFKTQILPTKMVPFSSPPITCLLSPAEDGLISFLLLPCYIIQYGWDTIYFSLISLLSLSLPLTPFFPLLSSPHFFYSLSSPSYPPSLFPLLSLFPSLLSFPFSFPLPPPLSSLLLIA